MKKLILLLLSCVFLIGCVQSYLDILPTNSFDQYDYHRGGNISTAHVEAIGGVKTDDGITIKSVLIDVDYPGFTLDIKIKGLKIENE